MINRGPTPEYFESDFVWMAGLKLEDFYYSDNRGQKRYDFPLNKKFDDEVLEYLVPVFFEKCGYCETPIGRQGFVDRFRPHSGVRDDVEYYQDLYWWLTFDWNNLVYCCHDCGRYKANYFPVVGKRAKNPGDDLEAEYHLLFDPCKDGSERHFNFDRSGTIFPLTDKGKQTIELLRLNRIGLKAERESAKEEIDALLGQLRSGERDARRPTEILRLIYNGDRSIDHSSFKKWYLLTAMSANSLIVDMLDVEKKKLVLPPTQKPYVSKEKIVANDYFPIEQVQIRNFKGIEDLRIDFKTDVPPERSWLFLLGENGSGKSSVLQAMALGLRVDEALLTPTVIRRLIRKGQEEAEITIKERDSDNIIRTFLRRSEGLVLQEGRFNSFLFGYGSLRLSEDYAEQKAGEDKQQISYDNLFHPVKPLNDITEWLMNIHAYDRTLFDRVAYSIKQLLPHDFNDNELTIVDGEIVFKNSEKSFSSLSDGFKSTIILAVDIMMKLSSANADMDKLSGVVLIDELGNQLHPRWQMRIVEQLRKVFTNLNFIVSTHHPLCLRGSQEGEILLMKQIEGKLEAITDLPDPKDLRVDQILSSEFFGLNSLIDPALEATFNRYYALLAREKTLTQGEREEFFKLKDQLREKKHFGSSLRDELMYAVIDSLLASKLHRFSRDELKAEAIKRVEEIWNKTNNREYDKD